jgi:DNA polymerase-3 subunit alpha (Gram-positive type)
MFPKAHATAYVLSAMRIAWFKVYRPLLFYSAFFSIRATQFDMETMCAGKNAVYNKIMEIESLKKGVPVQNNNDDENNDEGTKKINTQSKTTEELLTTLQVSLEMLSRGFKFKLVDINQSEASKFKIIDDKTLLMPFSSVNGMGMSVCSDIVEKRNERPFTSKKDVKDRTKINKTIFDYLDKLKVFKDFTEEEPKKVVVDEGIFGLFE